VHRSTSLTGRCGSPVDKPDNFQARSQPESKKEGGKRAMFSVRKPARREKAEVQADQVLKQMLQFEERLSAGRVDILYAQINSLVLQMPGESPPDPDRIGQLRSLAREFATARETLADATCRWHFFRISRKRVTADLESIRRAS
jgi:hypothetical protein